MSQGQLFGVEVPQMSATEFTPVEAHVDFCGDVVWLKRDDLYEVHGASGGKARVAYALATKGPEPCRGLTTCGARTSPQVKRVAAIAKGMGVPCTVHVPRGDISTGPVAEAVALGAQVVQHRAGYNNVIAARAREWAEQYDVTLVPFGCECVEAVQLAAAQCYNLPPEVGRLVVPVGSGMTLAGICWGLEATENPVAVLGVCAGADPLRRLDKWAPSGWREYVTLMDSRVPYSEYVEAEVGGVQLDPTYEAKCVEHMRAGDLLWLVGYR